MSTRDVEFYVLRTDRTWTTVTETLSGPDAEMSDKWCVRMAEDRLCAEFAGSRLVECVGPLYHLGEVDWGEGEEELELELEDE